MTSKHKNKFFRNTILIGLGAFLIATLVLFSLSSYDASKRFKERADELKDEIFQLKVNLSLRQQEIERLSAMVGDGINLKQGTFVDYTERGEGENFIIDTDNDGLVDEIDPEPDRKRSTAKTFQWEYEGNTHVINLNVNQDWYDYYKNKRRATTKEHFITPSDPTVIEITKQLFDQLNEKGYKSTTEFVMSFVQSLEYLEDNVTKGRPYPRYPVETIWEEVGDCEDLTYLGASILKNLNVDIALLDIPGHIVVGAVCANCEGAYWEHNGKKYYYIESTASGWKLGEIPPEYRQYEGKSILVRDVS